MITQDVVKERVLKMLVDDPTMILVLKNKYIDDDLWKFCIEKEPSLFKEMRDPSYDICKFAVNVDGYNLKYIRNKFINIKITTELAYIAITSCPKAIYYVPEKILDEGLKEKAFDKDPSLMKDFYVRPAYLAKRIKDNPTIIKYINNPLEYDNIICDVLITDPNICVYFDKWTPKMVFTLKTYHPEFIELFQNRITEEK